jgi:hypothetical protein
MASEFQPTLFDEETSLEALPMGGVDDMNFVELLHNLPGSRRPPKGETISVPWDQGERSYYVEYSRNRLLIEWRSRGRTRLDGEDFYVRVETPESKGLPNNLAGDVLVALMKFTAEQGSFEEEEIRTSRYELIRFMQWHHNGHYYSRLRDILSQFTHMTVATNALWDPETQAYYEGEFNILDSWEVEDSRNDAPDSTLVVRWGKKTLDIFSRGYLKHLDTKTYYSLSNSTTKRIYRWLDKHLNLYPVVEIDVLRFAHKILGYGVSYRYPSKVISKLSSKLDTLTEIGFCLWEVQESKSDSKKKFVFTRFTDYSPVTLPRRDYITRALTDRGVNQAETLVETYTWERCLRQLAHYEYHVRNGKRPEDPGAWLATAIRRDYALPEALERQMDRAREKTAEWCDQMYESLTDEDRKSLDREVDELLDEEGGEDTPRRRKQIRNQLLLSQVHTA